METITATNFEKLQQRRDALWAEIIENADWSEFVMSGNYDRRFYGIFLIQTYHYVRHNPKHQALVATRNVEMPIPYAQFCYEHAEEETGHEMMAYNDLVNLGLSDKRPTLPGPHPSTEVFIGYLYWVSSQGNPLRRLGYSFWAEDSYGYIAELMSKVKSTLGLDNSQMSFLVSHATIDEEHAKDIENMIHRFCKTEDDWQEVEKVLNTSLKLQSNMLDNVVQAYQALLDGTDSTYSFLNELQ